MKRKPILALGMACVSLCGLLSFPVSATTTPVPFRDISDSQVAESAQLLQLLGLVNGTAEGQFSPDRNLTRAEFCKIAVDLMGNGDLASTYQNRTIFKDVPSTHWARGYINLATASSEDQPAIIRGDAYGNFNPDASITYAEAVTILMRILGYSDSTVGYGSKWYDGYLITAGLCGLTEWIDLNPEEPLSRGDMARLLENFLYTKKVGEKEDYLTATLGCTTTDELLVLEVDAITPDGTPNAVKDAEGKLYKVKGDPLPTSLVGHRVTLMLNDEGEVLSAQESEVGTLVAVSILKTKYDSFTTPTGETVSLKPETPIWQDGEQDSTYKDIYLDLPGGTPALLQYGANGTLDYLFLLTLDEVSTDVTVLKSSNYALGNRNLYKNGLSATASDLRQYDVLTVDQQNNVVYASDMRLTGIYETAYPSPDTPSTITLLGEEFTVLPSAYEDLRQFEVGDSLTLLFTHDSKVAGAVTTTAAKSNTVGVVTAIEDGQATVNPLVDLRNAAGEQVELSGKTSYSETSAANMIGQVVTVSAYSQGRISLSKLSGSGTTSSFNVETGKIGTVKLSENVAFFEKVGNSTIQQIDQEQITVGTVPSSKIIYIHKDYAGRADVVLLDNVTGDTFQYGFLWYTPGDTTTDSTTGQTSQITPHTVTVKNGDQPDGGEGYYVISSYRQSLPVGIVGSLTVGASGVPKLETMVNLIELEDVKSSTYDADSHSFVTTDAIYPVSKYVQCYNKHTGTWFQSSSETDNYDALDTARAYSSTLTLYYDKNPEEGGKIRLVVVE